MSQDAGATVHANYLGLGLGTTAPESGIEVRLDDSLGQLQLGDNSGDIYHRYFVSMSGHFGNGTAHQVPRGVPGSGTSNFYTHLKTAIGGGTTHHHLRVDGTISGSLIHSSGDVVAFNTSDERLKDNIKVIKEPIEKIKQLRGVEYQWNEKQNTYPTGSLDSGIIAQDVQKVLPQLVKQRGDGYLGVRQERLVGLLVESIKTNKNKLTIYENKSRR